MVGKRVLRTATSQRIICWLVHLYIRFVYATGSWKIEGADIAERLRLSGKPFILAFWHGRLLMIPMAWQHMPKMHMLISNHPDGRIIAGAVRYFGIDSVAGSTTEGGISAVRAMVRFLKAGDCVGITPDGPDGPAMRASHGIVAIARLARLPIVPITYATNRRRILASWDRFHLPFPWSRGVLLWGEPMEVPAKLDDAGMEIWRIQIEDRMNALTREADRQVGLATVAPGTIGRKALRAARRATGKGG